MSSPSASFALWASCWLAGQASPDDVIDAVTAWAPMHLVAAGDPVTAGRTGLPWPSPQDTGITELLRTVRESSSASPSEVIVRLVLPAPGDVRGLAAGSEFAAAAIESGQGVLVGVPGRIGTGLVPSIEGPDVMRWTVFSAPVPHFTPDSSLREIEYSMRETVRDAAATLNRQQTAPTGRADIDPRAFVTQYLEEAHRHRLPELTERITRILDTADHVAAILAVAEKNSTLEGATGSAARGREDVLRPLHGAVRSARVVAVTTAIDQWLTGRDH